MKYLLLTLLFTSCASRSSPVEACYKALLKQIADSNKSQTGDDFVFDYQKRRAMAICEIQYGDM